MHNSHQSNSKLAPNKLESPKKKKMNSSSKSKYNVVKILGVEREEATNSIRIIKLVRMKKPEFTDTEVINIDDDDEKENVIEISDSEDEGTKEFVRIDDSFNLVTENSQKSSLKISKVESTNFSPQKSLPTVISITTDDVNNTNIFDQIQKARKSLPAKFETDSEGTDQSAAVTELNVNMRPRRAKKVPQKLVDANDEGSLLAVPITAGTKVKRMSKKRKSEDEELESMKPKKIQRRSQKNDTSENVQPENSRVLQEQPEKPKQTPVGAKKGRNSTTPKEIQQSSIPITKQVRRFTIQLEKINASKYLSVSEPNSPNLDMALRTFEKSASVPNLSKAEPKRKEVPAAVKLRTSERVKKIALKKLGEEQVRQRHLEIRKMILNDYPVPEGFVRRTYPKTSHDQSIYRPAPPIKYPSDFHEPESFFASLNLTANNKNFPLGVRISPEVTHLPPTPPPSAEKVDLNISSSKGYNVMKLKCHKTCVNSNVHQKKHKVDISSPLGMLLTTRDLVDEKYVQESLKRIEQGCQTGGVDIKAREKAVKTPRGRFGRKSSVSGALAEMKSAGLERNVMRRGRRPKGFKSVEDIQEFLKTEL